MAFRALTDVLLGLDPPASAGQLIPAAFRDMDGAPSPVDFARLTEIGAAEKVPEPKRQAKQ